MKIPGLCVLLIALLSCSVSILGAPAKPGGQCDSADRLPGKDLKWVMIAEPVFRERRLILDRYNIRVDEGHDPKTGMDTIFVLLIATDATCKASGSTGSVPNFEVRIDKNSGTVLGSNFEK